MISESWGLQLAQKLLDDTKSGKIQWVLVDRGTSGDTFSTTIDGQTLSVYRSALDPPYNNVGIWIHRLGFDPHKTWSDSPDFLDLADYLWDSNTPDLVSNFLDRYLE